MRRDPAPAQLPDANGSGCRGTGHPEVIESGEDPSAGLQLETEPEATVPPAGLDHAGRLGLGPRDPLRLPPHTACPAEPAPGFAVPPLEHGRSHRVPQRTGQERGCLLVAGLRELIQKLFDYGARRFGDGAPAQGGEGRDERDRRDRDDGKTEETFHDPEASNPCAASGPAGRAGTLKQGDRAFPRLEASLTDQSKKNRAGIRRGFNYLLLILLLHFFFFGNSSEELPKPLDDSPREEDDPLSESSLSKRPSSSLSRSLLEDPPRLLSLPRPEECRLSLSRSPRFSRLSSGT